jgi:hypothetical protein
MAVLLKQKDKENYIKSVSWVDGKVEFTDNQEDAKKYKSDWFADTEKQQLQHYSQLTYDEGGLDGDYEDIMNDLFVYYT